MTETISKKNLKEHSPYIAALIILTVVHLSYFFNVSLPAHDITTSYFPLAETLKISALTYGDLWPLWTPYGFSGSPLLMKPVLGLDSVMGLFVLAIPNTILALKLSYVILFLISGISMYSLMIYLKVDKKFAFISAMVYVLNAHMAKLLAWGWLTTLGGYSILPFAFMFCIKSLKEKDWLKNSVILGILLAVMLRLNPDMKVTMWMGIIFGIYILFNLIFSFSKQTLIKTLFVILVVLVIFLGLSAQRIVSNIDSINTSSRANMRWEDSSGRRLDYKDMFNRLIEPIYSGMPIYHRSNVGDHVGIIAFLLVGYAIYRKRNNKYVLFFGLGALFSVIVATNTLGAYYLLWKIVPFFKSLRYMDRSLFLFAFFCSALAGFGANELFEKIKKYKKTFYFSLILLILLNLMIFNNSPYTGGDPKEWSNGEQAIKNNHILNYLSNQQGPFRIQTWETRGIDWGTDFYNVPLKLEHIYKYDPIWYPPYMNVYLSVSLNDPAKFWGILNLKYLTARTELNISGFKFIKKFEACSECFPKFDDWAKAWGPYLYENGQFLPRAYLISDAMLVVGEKEAATQTIYALMLNKNFNPSNMVLIRGKERINGYSIEELKRFKAVFLTKGSVDQNSQFILESYANSGGIILPDITKGKNSISEGEINNTLSSFKNKFAPIEDKNIIMRNFDKREIKLNINSKRFLVYSELFAEFPGWKATSNAQNKEIYSADGIISALYLDGNETSLMFEYKPKSYIIGAIITSMTIILLLAYIGFAIYRKRKEKNLNTISNNNQ